MAVTPEQAMQQLADITQQNQTLTGLVNQQQNEIQQLTGKLEQHNVRLGQHEAEILNLGTRLLEATNKLTESRPSEAQSRITKTNLLKAKEPTPFSNKTSYTAWVEGTKADLYPILPELRDIIDIIEKQDTMDNDWVQKFITEHPLGPETAKAIDAKIRGLLHNLTRQHDTAQHKIKNNNAK